MTASSGPAHAEPFSWPPSEHWDGADGNWSSFALRVGSSVPEQVVRILPSTAGQALWVVAPGGCIAREGGKIPSETCNDSRGGLFDLSDSSTWSNIGNYSMGLEENLGYSDVATFGLDAVALGLSDALGGPHLGSQVVAAFENDDNYIGLFGLGREGTNFSTYSTPNATFLTALKDRNIIPSLSWGYTAGAVYQSESKGVFGSLTLGGYDSSRLVRNSVSFPLSSDVSRDLTVSLQSITVDYANGSAVPLLSEPIWTFIDSTIPNIYLPLDACKEFEKAFGLVWNTAYERYFVDDALHEVLVAENNNITLKLGKTKTGEPTVDICLPYSSFDLAMDYPLIDLELSGIRYFPLLRASNNSQYTLGRTFLQEAYVITNYEQATFSVFQSKFEDGVKPDIVAITLATTESHTHRTTKIGVSLGVIAFLLLSLSIIIILKKRNTRNHRDGEQDHDAIEFAEPQQRSVQEIATNSLIDLYRELPDSGKAELLDTQTPSGSGNELSELSGPSNSVVHELTEPFAPIAHELMTHYPPDGTSMVQNHASRSKYTIFVSTNMSRHSWTSIGTSTDTPCVETTIYSQQPKTIDLDRSLPPTPISDSPQVSPGIVIFGGAVTSSKSPEQFVADSAAVESVRGTVAQVPSRTHFNAWERRFAHSSHASMDFEIVIPPGPSETEIIRPLNVVKKSGRGRGSFF